MDFNIIIVYSALLILPISSYASGADRRRFGCSFEDRYYTYRRGNIFQYFFSLEEIVEPKIYGSVQQINEDLQLLRSIIEEMMATSVYDDVDVLVDFYQMYNLSRVPGSNTFHQFFERYHPVYREGTSLSRLADIFDRLLLTFRRDFEKHSYMVPIDGSLTLRDVVSYAAHSITPVYFNHQRIAAVVKFMIDNRLGLFIIDPDVIYNQIGVVMMDNGELPAGLVTTLNYLAFEMAGANYIVSYNPRSRLYMLYYVALAYCGMLDCATKVSLLNLAGRIQTQNRDGYAEYKIEFQFKPTKNPVIEFKIPEIEDMVSIPLDVELTLDESALQDEYNDYIYQSVLTYFDEIPYDIQTKLEWIKKIGLDTQFIAEANAEREDIETFRLQLKIGADV